MASNSRQRRQELRQQARQVAEGALEVATSLREGTLEGLQLSGREARRLSGELRGWLAAERTASQRVVDVQELLQDTRQQLRRRGDWAAMRSVDLAHVGIAYTRLQALQHSHMDRQAYAPFMLAFHEAQAGAVLSQLDESRREPLQLMAEKIRSAQLSMMRKLRRYDDCARCPRYYRDEVGGQCCSVWVGQWFRPIDGIFRRLLGERVSPWPRFREDWSRCGLMGPRGCMLPEGTRPIICAGFFCNDFREHLDKDKAWVELSPDFQRIREAIRTLEFRFSIHRRFLTSGGEPTIRGASIGYLFDKLLGMYASYDQIAPSENVEGIDAIGSKDAGPSTASTTTGEADQQILGTIWATGGAGGDASSQDPTDSTASSDTEGSAVGEGSAAKSADDDATREMS